MSADPTATAHQAPPMVRDLEAEAFEAVAQAAARGIVWSSADAERMLCWCGRIAAPYLLMDAWESGVLADADLAAHIGQAWSMAEFPDRYGHDRWRELFHEAGFTLDGRPAQRPAAALELWRGSVPERRTDWSWTTERAVAEQYASGHYRRPVGRLYRVLAPPSAMLAANTGRDEAEYVIDTTGLDIIECPTTPDRLIPTTGPRRTR
jgi:hypothetical protein